MITGISFVHDNRKFAKRAFDCYDRGNTLSLQGKERIAIPLFTGKAKAGKRENRWKKCG